jgi:hypothetical protein
VYVGHSIQVFPVAHSTQCTEGNTIFPEGKVVGRSADDSPPSKVEM